jgi:hypothetical protein
LERPPTYFVIHDEAGAAIEAVRSGGHTRYPNAARLAIELLGDDRYRQIQQMNGFRIHVLAEVERRPGIKSIPAKELPTP